MLRYNDLIDLEVKSGAYKGVPENTLVADVAKMEISKLIEICKECEQECVAVFDNCTRTGKLIYHPDFDGTRMQFDWNYFLQLHTMAPTNKD